MKRRAFLAALGGTVAAPALVAAPAPKDGARGKGTGADFLQPPTAQLVGPDALAICWRTAGASAGSVRWTQDPDLPEEKWATARRVVDGLVASNRPDHLVTLRGVDFTKPIRFRVESVATTMDPWWTRFGETTRGETVAIPPLVRAGDALTFAVLNDLHANTALIPDLLGLAPIAEANPAFVALNGDCAGNVSGPEQLRKALLGPMADLTARGVPMLFLRGNHEYRGVMARRLREAFATFTPTDAYYADFALGPLRLLLLDGGEDKVDTHREYCGLLACEDYLAQEGRWLRGAVATPEWKAAKRRLALCHIPPECGNADEDAKHGPARLRRFLSPSLREAGLAALLCAHTHREGFLPATEARPYPILIGGGPKAKNATVTLVRATPERLDITAYAHDGTRLHAINT